MTRRSPVRERVPLPRASVAVGVALVAALFAGGCASKPVESFPRFAPAPAAIASAPTSQPASQPAADSIDLPDDARLVDLLRYAALNNAALRAAYYRWQASLERPTQVKALPDPRITYSIYIEEVETRVGPQEQAFGVSQMIPWLRKLREMENVATEEALAAKARFDAEKFRLFYRVQDAWYEYYYLARAIDVVQSNIDLVKYFEEVARTKYKVGSVAMPAVIRSQVELGKLSDQARTLRDMRPAVAARLNAALNRPVTASLPWPPVVDEATLDTSEQELLALIESSPEIAALRHEVAKARSGIDLARQDYYPDFTVGVTYIDTGSALMPGVPDSGKDPVIAMVSLNVPLWRQKYRAHEREAVALHLTALSAQTERENTLASDIKMALFGYQDAQGRIDLYTDTLLPKARELLAAYESAFRTGTSTFLDLIDAQRVLLRFELSIERAIADRAQNLSKLEMLIGRGLGKDNVNNLKEMEVEP